jgi:hypothetical protein
MRDVAEHSHGEAITIAAGALMRNTVTHGRPPPSGSSRDMTTPRHCGVMCAKDCNILNVLHT